MIANWPASLPQSVRRGSWTGGAQDARIQFKPDQGVPIRRRAQTLPVMLFQGVFPNLRPAQRAVFETFYETDLAGGVARYSWRDPETGAAGLWQIMGEGESAYQFTSRGATLSDLSLRLMRLPGDPWWGPYLRPAASKVPHVVAHYAGGVFGVAGVKTAASAVALVAGTYDIYTTSTGGVETVQLGLTIAAGGIPASAPGGVAKKVAFLP